MDSLLSIVQMPAGVPVATVGIGNARNAGLLAVRILAASDPDLLQRMLDFQVSLRKAAEAKGAAVRASAAAARGGTTPRPDKARGLAMPGLLREFGLGVGLLGRGLGLIVRRPRLFLLGALPPLVTSVILRGRVGRPLLEPA